MCASNNKRFMLVEILLIRKLTIYPKAPYIKNTSFIKSLLFCIAYGIYTSLEKSIKIFPVFPQSMMLKSIKNIVRIIIFLL